MVASFNSARDELMQAFSAAGQEMYQAQAAEAEAEAGPEDEAADADADADAEEATESEDEEVVEADYEIVD